MTAASMAGDGARRRGRPQRLPEDPHSLSSGLVGCDQRIAWLVTTARVLGPRPRPRPARRLHRRAQGARHPRRQLPRVALGVRPPAAAGPRGRDVRERPRAPVQHARLRRRPASGAPSAPARPRATTRCATRTCPTSSSTGSSTSADAGERDRGRLAAAGRPLQPLRPGLPARAGLDPPVPAAGHASSGRRSAPATYAATRPPSAFIRHPNSRRHLTMAVGHFVTNPDTQVVAPVLNLLSEVPDPAAAALTLRMLSADSDNRYLRRAASSVAATKLARGHFDETALPRLESHVIGALRRGESLDGRLDAFDLAVRLPESSWDQVSHALRTRRAFAQLVDARRGGELVSSARAGISRRRPRAGDPGRHSHPPGAGARPDAAPAAPGGAAPLAQAASPPRGAADRRLAVRPGRGPATAEPGLRRQRPDRRPRVDRDDAGRRRRPARRGRPPGHRPRRDPRSARARW